MKETRYPRLAKAGTAAERRERWGKRAIVIGAALLGVPLLVLSILFALEVASIAVLVAQLDGEVFGTVVLASLGWIGLICYLAFLFAATRRDTWRWRWIWSAAAVLAAGALPLSWVFLGWLPGGS